MLNNDTTKQLNIQYPIVQAPMAGGITTPNFVAEVSNNGGLGMIGAGYLTPSQTREQIREVKQLTSNPFGINLFVPNQFEITHDTIESANRLLHSIHQQLNIEEFGIEVPESNQIMRSFVDQLQVVIEENVPICSFTFGLPSKEVIAELKQHQITVIGTATTVREAVEVENSGMDMVVVQGSEAGGHRGNFIDNHEDSLIGLMSLIPQVAECVSIPVIAAGGIMNGRGVIAAMILGAEAVQMGTAFLTCTESGAHDIHKEAILNAQEDQTTLTRAFSGKWARGIKNNFISEMKDHERLLPDFPIQNMLTQRIRKTGSEQRNPEFMSLWSGQSPGLAQHQTVKKLMRDIVSEMKKFNFADESI
ncbi:NAD(P)H-dependent flavin oxidoreductase [Paenibacillus lemnae]|uniref:Probable nitronate monooxygenase n=1 Tax=Paenibacillus lemnae TaxID=1330551 RepID=A0A848M5N3_PAELE|nr:nitronate monooxygenase [Paenibacillus lemnae]NMO94914.1 nitronate monooxygenase [Paenibacillus lemnae]